MLDVHLYGRHVAHLVDASDGEVGIRYTADAVATGNRVRISLALPVRAQQYPSRRGGNRWARSILPEPAMRDRIAAEFGLEADDYYGMLGRIGRDVAGAVVVVPAGEPAITGAERAELLGSSDVARIIDQLPTRPLGVDRERGVRLSLAGVQDKLLLVRDTSSGADSWSRPLDGYPSTHILKPEPGRFPGLATNELFCLNLARASGLTAASASIERFGGTQVLVVERYDRRIVSGYPERIHQEDILTAMGRDPVHKYEWDDERGQIGPTLVDFSKLIRDHIGGLALLQLLDFVTFNVAIGNADAHARNLSLLLQSNGEVGIAPLYDVVYTRMYEQTSSDLSQRINSRPFIDDVTVADIVEEAAKWGVTRGVAHRRVSDLLYRMDRATEPAAGITREGGGEDGMTGSLEYDFRTRISALRKAADI